jgi:hypothetical protein
MTQTQHAEPPAAPPEAYNHHHLDHLQRRLLEAFDTLWDDFVDPEDALYDESGLRWSLLGASAGGPTAAAPFTTESQLRDIRNQCRALATANEFAINGHENQFTRTTFRVRRRFRAFRPGSGPSRAGAALPGTGHRGARAGHWGSAGGVRVGRQPGSRVGRRRRACPDNARAGLGARGA